MDLFRTLLSHKFEVDEREPIVFWTVPGTEDDGGAVVFGITGMDPRFWLISFALLSVQSVTSLLAAVAMYHYVLMQRGTVQSYLIGYGIICPALFYLPFVLIPYLDLRNVAFMACFALTAPAIISFRCLEAMHGSLPPWAFDETKPSLSRFALFNAAALQFRFDPQTQAVMPFTKEEATERILHFGRIFLETTILYSVLLPLDYKLFPHREIHSFVDLFHVGNLANNWIVAYLTGVALESGATGLGLLTSAVTGLSVTKFNDHPLTRSTSPSDFWGRRWNKLVNQELRRGVFHPLRRYGFHRSVAALATFLASGLLHEYVLYVSTFRGSGAPDGTVLRHNNPQGAPFVPSYGNHLLFFAWNGAVLLGEHVLADTWGVQWLRTHLARPVRTALVLLTVLPIAHLFTDEYVASCFYSDIAMGFPKIVRVR